MSTKTLADFGIHVPHAAAGEVDVICPQCSPTRKKKTARCLSVNVAEGIWTCHHCGFAGSIHQGSKSVELAWRKPTFRRPEPPRTAQDGPIEFLLERGIPAAVIERNGIRVSRVYMPQVEDHVKAVAFLYFRGDELINVKYRDREKNFRMETGAERVLYGLNDIDPELCVIVEGEIDKLSVETAGVRSCVSVPDGAPSESAKNYSGKFSFLESDHEQIEAVKQWIIAVDDDAPGKRLEDELARRLGRDKCRRVTWPNECKDANDVLRSFGPELLKECLDNAEPFPLAGVFAVLDCSAEIDQLYEHGWEKGVSTGWLEVDQLYTVRAGEFTVVTGMPNSGKSNWLDALLVNLAEQFGWNFAMFSPENQPLADHMARMMEKWARAPFEAGSLLRMDREQKDRAKLWLNDHFTWILPEDDSDWTIDTVLDRAKALVFRRGIRGLVIDPWNELEHALTVGMSETIYTGQVLKRVRQFSRRHGVHVWVVAHPRIMHRDSGGQYPVPTLYDISGSANWRNKADNGVVIWRDFAEPKNPVEVHVQKVRFRQIGRIGMAKLEYDRNTQTYKDLRFEDFRHSTGSAALPPRRKKKEAVS